MSLLFLKEEKKVKKSKVMGALSEGFARREMSSRPAGGGRGCEQTGPSAVWRPDRKGARPPDGTRDNDGLSRHSYLLQRSAGTGRRTFSRESCLKLLGGPGLAGGMRLA